MGTEVPAPPAAEPDGFLGVDLGIANIATTSDGTTCSGKRLNRLRRRNARLRAKLQAKGTKQLGRFTGYKARRAGVALVHVDPAYTSQQCSACGHTDRKNRPRQAIFHCTSCAFAEHADVNAARNIAARGARSWADVMQPDAA